MRCLTTRCNRAGTRFGYDEKTKALTLNEFDRKSFNGDQLNLIDRIGKGVNLKNHNATLHKVGNNEKFKDLDGSLTSLSEKGAHGLTLTAYFIEGKTNFVTGSESRVYYSSEPVLRVANPYGKKTEEILSSSFSGFVMYHELGGHLFENITNPYLSSDYRNESIELFERTTILRLHPLSKGFGDKHGRSQSFLDYQAKMKKFFR